MCVVVVGGELEVVVVLVPDGGHRVTLGEEIGGKRLEGEDMTTRVDRVEDEDIKGRCSGDERK